MHKMLPGRMYDLGLDCTFELDAFAKPRLRSEAELIKNTLLYILMSKPGQYPSLPFIGMDISNLLYNSYDELKESDLADEIIKQCPVLARYFDDGTIIIRKIKYKGQPSLMIHVETSPIENLIGENMTKERFQIGITFNELNDMIYNVTEGRSM